MSAGRHRCAWRDAAGVGVAVLAHRMRIGVVPRTPLRAPPAVRCAEGSLGGACLDVARGCCLASTGAAAAVTAACCCWRWWRRLCGIARAGRAARGVAVQRRRRLRCLQHPPTTHTQRTGCVVALLCGAQTHTQTGNRGCAAPSCASAVGIYTGVLPPPPGSSRARARMRSGQALQQMCNTPQGCTTHACHTAVFSYKWRCGMHIHGITVHMILTYDHVHRHVGRGWPPMGAFAWVACCGVDPPMSQHCHNNEPVNIHGHPSTDPDACGRG